MVEIIKQNPEDNLVGPCACCSVRSTKRVRFTGNNAIEVPLCDVHISNLIKVLTHCECVRCGWGWYMRGSERPLRCTGCGNTNWDEPSKRNNGGKP